MAEQKLLILWRRVPSIASFASDRSNGTLPRARVGNLVLGLASSLSCRF